MKKTIKSAVIATALLFASSAGAAVINSANTPTAWGPGQSANLQGLDWLSLDVTAGQSRTAVEANTTLQSQGWRYASRTETETLITSVWGGSVDGWSATNFAGAEWFVETFGILGTTNNTTLTNRRYNEFFFGNSGECSTDLASSCAGLISAVDNATSTIFSYELTNGVWAQNSTITYAPNSGVLGYINDVHGADLGRRTTNVAYVNSSARSTLGSLLVRSSAQVPSPAPIALLGLGLATIGFLRRRRPA